MEYTNLGRTGLSVSRLCLGTMNFGPQTTEAGQLRASWTAPSSTASTSSTPPTSTAGSSARASPSRSSAAGSPRAAAAARRSCWPPRCTARWATGPTSRACPPGTSSRPARRSLRRLQTDWIDLYQMHHVSRTTPWEEIWQAMETLVAQGKVLYVGSSNFAGWHLAAGAGVGQPPALPRPRLRAVHLQPDDPRTSSWRCIPAAQHYGIGIIPWSPLHGGLLGGALAQAGRGHARRAATSGRAGRRARRAPGGHRGVREAVRRRSARTRPNVALAWLLSRPGVTAPIIGPRTMEQLDGPLRALELTSATTPWPRSTSSSRRSAAAAPARRPGPGSAAVARCGQWRGAARPTRAYGAGCGPSSLRTRCTASTVHSGPVVRRRGVATSAAIVGRATAGRPGGRSSGAAGTALSSNADWRRRSSRPDRLGQPRRPATSPLSAGPQDGEAAPAERAAAGEADRIGGSAAAADPAARARPPPRRHPGRRRRRRGTPASRASGRGRPAGSTGPAALARLTASASTTAPRCSTAASAGRRRRTAPESPSPPGSSWAHCGAGRRQHLAQGRDGSRRRRRRSTASSSARFHSHSSRSAGSPRTTASAPVDVGDADLRRPRGSGGPARPRRASRPGPPVRRPVASISRELVRPRLRAVLDEGDQELVDAVEGEVGRDRGDAGRRRRARRRPGG